MSSLNDTGSLMHLYLDEIEPEEGTNAPDFLIKASAHLLNEKGGRNWIPVIVKETGRDKYQVIGNSFIYAVAEEAGLDRVWCIIADGSVDTAEVIKVLAGERIPKINLSTASRDEILSALEYLLNQPGSALKDVKLAIATNRIDEAPREHWKTLDPIVNLKCGITKGKKLDALKQIFYLVPQPIPKVNLSTASRDEILSALEYLLNQPGSALKDVKLAIATNRIDEAPRQYWETLDPIAKLGCGITKGKKLDALKQVFYLVPQPIPKVNLSTASRDEILSALEYLLNQPGSALKDVKLAIATNRIDEAPRQYWETLDPIAKLGCGITKGKKVDALKQIFYLVPQPMPDIITDVGLLKTISVPDLKKMAKKRGIVVPKKIKKDDLVEMLSKS